MTFSPNAGNDAYFVPLLTRIGGEGSTTLDVEAVSPTFAHSTAASATVSW